MILEILGLILFLTLLTFPMWIENNWKNWLFTDKKTKEYLKNEKLRLKMIKHKEEKKIKICTRTQPYKIDEKTYAICNFTCDGNCMFP
jgi:hypothetical protein